MRSALLLLLLIAWIPFSLYRPKWGMIGYLFFALSRPDIMAWDSGSRGSMILAVVTVIGALLNLHRLFSELKNVWIILLVLFAAFCCLSAVLAVSPELAYPRLSQFLRAICVVALIPVLLNNEEDLGHGIIAMGLAIGVIGTRFGLYSMIHGGVQYKGGYGGLMSDNNTLALALVMGVPLCWFGAQLIKTKWLRAFLFISLFFTVTTIIMTFSRGAFLALALSSAMILRHSRARILVATVLLICALPALYYVRNSYLDRLETIADYENDSSALGRLNNAQAAFRMWLDYPIHGVGFGTENQRLLWRNYVPQGVAGSGLVIHNTYLQLLADCGIFAFLFYMILLFGMIRWLGRSAKRERRERRPAAIPEALRISLAAGALGSVFLSRVDFDFTYMLIMAGAAWWSISRRRSAPMPESVPIVAGRGMMPYRAVAAVRAR